MPLTQPPLPAKIVKHQIPSLYRWIAPTHDWLAALVEAEARQNGLAKTQIRDGETVLEVAVGTGLSFKHLLKHNPSGRTVGVDLTPAMLKRARKRASRFPNHNYELHLGDAYDLGFPDATFDLVLNSYMFDLLPVDHFVPVLAEFKRVLKPGGRLVQINMTRGVSWYNGFWDGLYRIHPALLGGCRGVQMEGPFKEAGFVQVEREFISQWTFPSEVVFGLKP